MNGAGWWGYYDGWVGIHWSQISAWHSISIPKSKATIQKTHWSLLAVGPWWKPVQVDALKGEGRVFVFIMDLQFKNRMSLWCDDYGKEKFCKFFLDLDIYIKMVMDSIWVLLLSLIGLPVVEYMLATVVSLNLILHPMHLLEGFEALVIIIMGSFSVWESGMQLI